MRAVIVLIALASLSVPALAQTRLPRTSPSEREVQGINRSLRSQQQQLESRQQNQFEINQLRQDLRRQQNTPSLIGPNSPAAVGVCAPGSTRC
jgi:hypothetical protein